MAQPRRRGQRKQVGYIVLEWTCPVCSARNPGPLKSCSSCGAPQPPDAKFEPPLQATILEKGSKEAEQAASAVAAGADIYCPYCGSRNPAAATACQVCQGALTGGKARESGAQLGEVNTAALPEVTCHVCGAHNPATQRLCAKCGSPLKRRDDAKTAGAPAALPKPEGGGVALWWLLGGAVLLIGIIAAFAWFGSRTENRSAVAEEARWVRTITVAGLVPVELSAWQDQLPQDARVLSCESTLRSTSMEPVAGAEEVCGEPYAVDTGTGFGEVYQDCEYRIYDDRCTYETLQWMPIDTVESSGIGFAPTWPTVGITPDRRIAGQEEKYMCTVNADGETFSFELSPDRYAQCQPGTTWNIAINGLGSLVDATPQ